MKPKDLLDRKKGRRITVRIPAATSNLGPGLDTFGLALALYCRLTFVLLEKNDPNIPLVTFSGPVVTESLPAETGQVVYKMLRQVWTEDPQRLECIRIHVDSDIPLGCGLGGSTAAILGAIWAKQMFSDKVPTAGDLLARATELEGQGHSETFAASLLGDFVIVAKSVTSDSIIARQHRWPESWKILVVIPNYRLNTAVSKALLPKQLSFADGMFNMQRAALLVSAVANTDALTLREALHDKFHESYRGVLVPELASLRAFLESDPILGCVLSGGGSSVVVIVQEKDKAAVRKRIEAWLAMQKDQPRILDVEVDREGLRELPYARRS